MPTVHVLHADTYLAMIQGSVNTNAYRHAYALVDGVRQDVANDGEYSCAFFVTSVLLRFQLLKEPHLRVQGTVADLVASGWIDAMEPKIGDILIWEPVTETDGAEHLHIGFYVGSDQAISNRPKQHSPQEHHWTFGNHEDGSVKRVVTRILTHPTFFDQASYR